LGTCRTCCSLPLRYTAWHIFGEVYKSHYTPLITPLKDTTMTLTFELDLDIVKMKQRAKCLGERLSTSKVIVRTHTHRHTHTHTHTCTHTHSGPIGLPGPLGWKRSVKAKFHYASWLEDGSELVGSWLEAGSDLVRSWFEAGWKLVAD